MTTYGPLHKLIVHDVGEDDEPFHLNDFAESELQHPAECESEVFESGTDHEYTIYRCGVQSNADAVGLRWSLRYSGCPITEPGEYLIQAWAETIRGFDYTEYDGGIGLVEDAA